MTDTRLVDEVVTDYLSVLSFFGRKKNEIENECSPASVKTETSYYSVYEKKFLTSPADPLTPDYLLKQLKHFTVRCFFTDKSVCQFIAVFVPFPAVYDVLIERFQKEYEDANIDLPNVTHSFMSFEEQVMIAVEFNAKIGQYIFMCQRIDIEVMELMYETFKKSNLLN